MAEGNMIGLKSTMFAVEFKHGRGKQHRVEVYNVCCGVQTWQRETA